MEHCTLIRGIRVRYGVTLTELARAAGISAQAVSQVELGIDGQTPYHERLLRDAFSTVIAGHRNRLDKLEKELADTPWLFAPAKEVSEHDP